MNAKTFNDLEALEIAIETERRGKRFYEHALNIIEDQEAKKMLKDLAEQEEEHIKTFKALYDELYKNKDKFDDTYLYDPEVVRYFHVMVETAVFPSDEEQDRIIKEMNGIKDVLSIGIKAEKDSILFYVEMVIHSNDVEAKDAFRKIIREEKTHLIDLQEKLISLT